MTWSYTRQLKAELAQTPIGALPCCWAELWGLSGQVEDPFDLQQPWVRGGIAFVVRRAYRIMKRLQLEPQIRLKPYAGHIEFSVWGCDVPAPDVEQSVYDCPQDFVRGAFLARGYVSEVDRPMHWEIAPPNAAVSHYLVGAMQALGVNIHVSARRGQPLLYLKDRAQVTYVLGRMGAYQSVLTMESQGVVRSMKNQVNRLVNSETANMKRMVDSAVRDAHIIARVMASGRWERLPPAVQEVGILRIKHPEWSFDELGRHVHPPISKSAVNHRLRRIRLTLQNELENR
ncbi:MAG: DNA-binding protein WhiA [Sulfobacillus acidophilus]|uniref:Probable cell division protein WhiA n=1 Tax=Sulfobacillus acidophilus TaxID=53633 RepID=A0A2T2WMK7_9FIRM|nr:MAG: DNA-binding protein WhiA [Sulfobacillus acidophilus]